MLIAVGGDYTKPNESTGTAAWSADGGQHWTASTIPPHGFRSAVQWSEALKAWITVGTNGSDISRDDGKTWQPLDNGNWNALSLPFVVGPRAALRASIRRRCRRASDTFAPEIAQCPHPFAHLAIGWSPTNHPVQQSKRI